MLSIRVGIHVKSQFLNLAVLGCTIFRFYDCDACDGHNT